MKCVVSLQISPLGKPNPFLMMLPLFKMLLTVKITIKRLRIFFLIIPQSSKGGFGLLKSLGASSGAGFLNLYRHYWPLGLHNSLLWETVMCIVGGLEASLASTHRYQWNAPFPPNCDDLRCLQALTKFPQGHNYTWLRITGLVSTMNDQGDNSIFGPQPVVECEALSLLFMWWVQKLTPKTFSKKEMPRYFK